MFAVIISEKGGAERREAFDKTEINVGRVQGNELMLPKGNVSKRHARLLFRDGRFIVTDLKSTNGTYVNGRKIAQATIVREGDKIYIGDFVLRIESAAGGSGQVAAASPPPEEPGVQSLDGPAADLTSGPSLSHASVVGPLPGPPSDPPSSRQSSPNVDTGSSPRVRLPSLTGASVKPPGASDRQIPKPPEPVISSTGSSDPSREIISHFPLENDPDDASGVSVPAPPRVPMTAGPRVTDIGMAPPPLGSRPPGPSGLPPRAPPVKPPVSGPPRERGSQPGAATPPPLIENPRTPSREGLPPFVPGPATIAAPAPSSGFGGGSDVPRPPLVQSQAHTGDPGLKPPPLPSDSQRGGMRRALPPASDRVQEPPATPARRLAVRAILEPVARLFGPPAAEKVDDARAAELDRALADAAAALKARGEVPPGIELDALLLDARREQFELGPLTSLLDDEDVAEIHVMAHDYVVGVHGRRHIPSEVGFTSEAAVETVLRRLCAAAGQPLQPDERFVERRLARGARLFVVRPTAADQGHMMVIRKPQRADLTLEDLVRSGTVSRAMAGLLQQCVAARANILVTGAIGAGATSLLGALAAAGSTDDRVVVLQEDDELIFNQPHTISILLGSDAVENTRAVQAAARIRPDRLVVGAFAGAVAAEMVDAMGDGVDGVLAAARAPTLRQAGPRLAADLAATRPGVPADTAREWLVSAFDLAVEIGRLRDGRHRVMRIAELTIQGGAIVPRDVFTFTVERTAAGGAVEGAFHPTGVIPGIVEDLAARGVQIDQSIFGRHPSSR